MVTTLTPLRRFTTLRPGFLKIAFALLAGLSALTAGAGPLNDPWTWGAYTSTYSYGSHSSPGGGKPGEVWNSGSEDGGKNVGAASSQAMTPLSFATAEASIADGILRVAGWASKPPVENPEWPCCGTAGAISTVRMTDLLHFEATEIGRVVEWELRINGSLEAPWARANIAYGFTGVPWEMENVWFAGGDLTVGGDFVLGAGVTDVPIDLILGADVGLGTADVFPAQAGYDLSHTVHFDVHVPDGVHASSASGLFVFNREAVQAVPEPGTLWLTLAGSSWLFWLARRRGH